MHRGFLLYALDKIAGICYNVQQLLRNICCKGKRYAA